VADEFFLKSLIRERGLNLFQAREVAKSHSNPKKDAGGRGAFTAIKGFPAVPGFSDLKGLVIMTDNDDSQALPETVKILENIDGYTSDPSDSKMGIFAGKPVKILLVPDDNNFGDLETLCLPVLYDKWQSSKECVETYLECTGAIRWRKKLNKARVRSIIAGNHEDDPNKGLGYLFSEHRQVISTSHQCFDKLVEILKEFAASVS